MEGHSLVAICVLLGLAACQSASTPTASPQATAVPGACANPYVPVAEGAMWMSNYSSDQEGSSNQMDMITDVGSDAFLMETTRSDGSDYVITWTCTPQGLLWLQTNGGMFSAVFPDAQWVSNSHSGVSLPKGVQPGDSWSSSESLTATDSTGSRSFDLNLDFQAIGMETVTVPAGTFNALRIDIVMEFVGQEFDITYNITDWVAENVGLVKSTAQSSGGGSGYSLELASFMGP